MKARHLVLKGTQAAGGLWTLELEGTGYKGSGGTLREAFEHLLEAMFEAALEAAVRAAGELDA